MSTRRSRIAPWVLFLGAAALILAAGLGVLALLRPSASDGLVPVGSLPAALDGARVLLAVGDVGSCDAEADEAVARLAAALPGRVALLGDIAYPDGSVEDFATCFDPAWGPMKDRLRPVPGNHEYETDGAAGYFDYFGAAAGEAGEGWYSYDHGSWHVIALNSNCDAVGGCGRGSPQLEWLAEDLRAHPTDCTLAYWHHPRFSTGRHGDGEAIDPIWQALVDDGVDVVLAGHDHSYERQRRGGVRSFVVGTGGRSLYAFPLPPAPETEVRHDDAYGLLWLALRPGSYEWRFLSASAGGFTDAGGSPCH